MTAVPWEWSGHPPRRWQPACLDAIKAAGLRSAPVAHVVMGAGKSVAISEIARRLVVGGRSVIVTVPTVQLVEQMRADLQRAVGTRSVGCVYTHERCAVRPVSVVCHDSVHTWVECGGRADVWISDECHRTEGPTMAAWIAEHAPSARVGFSATPWTADETQGLSAWRHVCYSYGPRDAIADGVLVPWSVRVMPGADNESADDRLLRMMRTWPPDGPGIVSAASIADAESRAKVLSAAGYPALPIHSRMSGGDRERAVNALQDGRLACLVHVNMLVEGANYPWLRWIALCRPTANRVRYPQEVGRVLRAWPGKSHATVYDLHNVSAAYGMTYEAALGWSRPRTKAGPREVDPDAALLPPPLPPRVLAREVSTWQAWVSSTLHDLDLRGVIVRRTMTQDQRDEPSTQRQVDACAHALEAFDERWKGPDTCREQVREGLRHAAMGAWTTGDTSDVLSLYAAGVRGWALEERGTSMHLSSATNPHSVRAAETTMPTATHTPSGPSRMSA